MIALVFEDRCTGCGDCVKACPTNVFEMGEHAPKIARVDDCQTCFLCELYCRNDALYVEPHCDRLVIPDIHSVALSGLLGGYRRDSGWHEWQDHPAHTNEHWRMGKVFQAAQGLNSRDEQGNPLSRTAQPQQISS